MEEPGIFGVRENSETATGKLFSHALLDCCMHVCGVSACVCVCVCVCAADSCQLHCFLPLAFHGVMFSSLIASIFGKGASPAPLISPISTC